MDTRQENAIPESFLAGRVPYLQPDHGVGLVIDNLFGLETGSDGARRTRWSKLISYISLDLKSILGQYIDM